MLGYEGQEELEVHRQENNSEKKVKRARQKSEERMACIGIQGRETKMYLRQWISLHYELIKSFAVSDQ